MSKLLYSATMSLDGFIAGVGGDMSCLSNHLVTSSPEIDELMDGIGALLVGKRTFTGDDPNRGTEQEGAFGGQWHGPSIVLTHEQPPVAADPDVTFVADLETAVHAAKRAAGGKYVNVLGANVAKQCLKPGCSMRSWCSSPRSSSGMEPGSSTTPAEPTSGSSRSTQSESDLRVCVFA